jgi:hypothetical protein
LLVSFSLIQSQSTKALNIHITFPRSLIRG